MKKFTQFIKESVDSEVTQQDIDEMKKLTQFMDSQRDRERYNSALDKFFAAYQAKEIYNADFGELYSYSLARPLENAWEKLYYPTIQKFRDDDEKFNLITADGIFSINSIAKMLRYHEKNTKNIAPELYGFLNSLRKLQPFIKTLKTYIIKGRKPKPVDPNAFVKPMVPYEAKKQALSFLNDAVDQIRQQYYEQMENRLEKIKDAIVADVTAADNNYNKVYSTLYKQGNSEKLFLFQRLFDMDQSGPRTVGFYIRAVLSKDSDKQLKKIAKDQVDEIINDFLGKNSEKLGHIFAKKAKVTEHKIVHNYVRNGVMENTMTFKFDDNTSFTVYTSTVYGYSNRGKFFARFPTRFTNVVMKDGSKMGMPSEEKMIKEF